MGHREARPPASLVWPASPAGQVGLPGLSGLSGPAGPTTLARPAGLAWPAQLAQPGLPGWASAVGWLAGLLNSFLLGLSANGRMIFFAPTPSHVAARCGWVSCTWQCHFWKAPEIARRQRGNPLLGYFAEIVLNFWASAYLLWKRSVKVKSPSFDRSLKRMTIKSDPVGP